MCFSRYSLSATNAVLAGLLGGIECDIQMKVTMMVMMKNMRIDNEDVAKTSLSLGF